MDSLINRLIKYGRSKSITDVIQEWLHVPILVIIMIFMFWVRTQAYENFIRNDGAISFAGVDSWYHWRTTMYTVQNWPFTMPYEIWTGYPTGRYVGQFGTLFDQIVATIALLIGLGTPSDQTVFQVALLMPPVFAALCVIPVYYIGRRLGGSIGGLIGASLLALFPGVFLERTTVGMLQHHAAEVLFMTVAVLAMMVALTVAEHEKPSYERLLKNGRDSLLSPFLYSVFAGISLVLYIWVWPPAVVLIGIFGVFFAITLTVNYLIGRNPEYIAFVGTVSLGTTGLLTLITREVSSFSVTSAGLLQPLLAFSIAGGCILMAWLAKKWDASGLNVWLYPFAISGLIGISMILLAVILPDAFETIITNLQRRAVFGQSVSDLTIQEARPPSNIPSYVLTEFGLAFFTAIIGMIALLRRQLIGANFRAAHLLIVVWAIFITSMAFTQVRFGYYLAIVVAILNARFIRFIIDWADLASIRRTENLRRIKRYQIVVVLGVTILLFIPLITPIAGSTAITAGADAGPSIDTVKWQGSNEWVKENTPKEGTYGGADNSLEYYGTYEQPGSGGFDYLDGAYGIMSWWDYGHLITVQGERIPHANPFQQNADSASEFFTANSEEESESVLNSLNSDKDGEGIKYVMIDDSMVGGKFYSITGWSGPDYQDYLSPHEYQMSEDQTTTINELNENYHDSTLSRLYYDDAEGMNHYRLVHESDQKTTFVSVAQKTDDNSWQSVYVNIELDMQIYQLVESRPDLAFYNQREGATVKTYERVDGAEITGTVDAQEGETVTAIVPMQATNSDRTFEYTQQATVDENGEFTMTVPYATDNDLGPSDGYTDASVVAEDEYTIFTGKRDNPDAETTTTVSESAVYEGETINVELENTNS